MTEDTVRGTVFAFGGTAGQYSEFYTADSFAFDGTRWRRLTLPNNPPPRTEHALAFDPIRRVVVMFGGASASGLLRDTWLSNGRDWLEVHPVHRPSARSRHAMAWDPGPIPGVLLFGGGGTWAWDGFDWQERSSPVQPPASSSWRMASDTARRCVVLFGGGGTWEWHSTWIQRSPQHSPPARSRFAMAFDPVRARTVVFGGQALTVPYFRDDLWEWDGVDWIQRNATGPRPRQDAAMAWHSGAARLVLQGGLRDDYVLVADSWLLDGSGWSPMTAGVAPPKLADPVLVFDTQRCEAVLAGSPYSGALAQFETWAWDGEDWLQRFPAQAPSARIGHAMAHDPVRNVTVLYGGGNFDQFGDTWEWNGSDWTLRQATGSPQPRQGHALFFDGNQRRIVMFGGLHAGSWLDTTWEWNGSDWRLLLPNRRPPGRARHAIVFDADAGQAVLFGGENQAGVLGDTWSWDGTIWTQRTPAASPSPRRDHAMCWDASRRRIVLLAGIDAVGAPLEDVWEWEGATWLQRAVSDAPPARGSAAAAYVPTVGRVLLFGGNDGAQLRWRSDTWTYGPQHPARFTVLGSGCVGSSGIPALSWTALPWIGTTFTLQVTGITAGLPVAVALGLSDTTWGTTPLPLALDPLGMPGCTLFTSVEQIASAVVVAEVARLSVAIPTMPSLLGAEFHLQAVQIDPGANAAGLVLSNAVTGVIGGR